MKAGDFVMLHYSDWGKQLGCVAGRARDGQRWRIHKFMRQGERWTKPKLVHPEEVASTITPDEPWVRRAKEQFRREQAAAKQAKAEALKAQAAVDASPGSTGGGRLPCGCPLDSGCDSRHAFA